MPKVVDVAERRRLVAEAALDLAAREGMGSVTVGQVAVQAGISKGAVQHWFPSKRSLLVAASARLRERIEDRVGAAVSSAGGDPSSRLTALLVALVPDDAPSLRDVAAGHALFAVVLDDAATRELVVAGRRLALDGVAALVAAARPAADARGTARLLLGVVGDLADGVLLGELTATAARREVVAVLDGLR